MSSAIKKGEEMLGMGGGKGDKAKAKEEKKKNKGDDGSSTSSSSEDESGNKLSEEQVSICNPPTETDRTGMASLPRHSMVIC